MKNYTHIEFTKKEREIERDRVKNDNKLGESHKILNIKK